MIAVILWLLADLDDLRQQRVTLRYATDHDLTIVALAHDPADAVTLVHDGGRYGCPRRRGAAP